MTTVTSAGTVTLVRVLEKHTTWAVYHSDEQLALTNTSIFVEALRVYVVAVFRVTRTAARIERAATH